MATFAANAPLKKGAVRSINIPDDEKPRFAVRILDVADAAPTPCACFVIPRGQEHEHVFSSDEGLSQIAASAKCARLLAVALDPARAGHAFGDLPSVWRAGRTSSRVVAAPRRRDADISRRRHADRQGRRGAAAARLVAAAPRR